MSYFDARIALFAFDARNIFPDVESERSCRFLAQVAELVDALVSGTSG
jgi:hypothetical protein